jgi:hypothetical protein
VLTGATQPRTGRIRREASVVLASGRLTTYDDLLVVDSRPVERARSRETVKRGGLSTLPDALTDRR